MSSYSFDPNNVSEDERANPFDLLPADWYVAVIDDSELMFSEHSDWVGLRLRYRISGPKHAGRVVFGSPMTVAMQSKPKAESIGRQQQFAMTCAMNRDQPFRFDIHDANPAAPQIHGRPMEIRVIVKQPTAREKEMGYDEARNDVKGWRPLKTAAPGSGSSPSGPPPVRDYGKPAPAPAPDPGPRTDVPPPTDDDLPF